MRELAILCLIIAGLSVSIGWMNKAFGVQPIPDIRCPVCNSAGYENIKTHVKKCGHCKKVIP